ncbi:uncharacterized protein LOC135689051 [Rhopilema esculentum]|uniref:uncharacterized protein LOC135689051 n=1 Tax=Rhopilema esculentum TaxID=499914 RepID=UPI0031DC82A5
MSLHLYRVFFVLLYFMNLHANGSIVRLPCKMQMNFDIVLPNIALANTALSTYTNTNRRQCCLHCLSHPKCKSANHNKDTGLCEIFDIGFLAVIQKLTEKAGWTFLGTTDEENTCFSKPNPCKNGGVCKESCNTAGYECSCPKGFYGDNCQDDLMSLLSKFCSLVLHGTLPRFDGSSQNLDGYQWRCYKVPTLRADKLLWAGSLTEYFTRTYLASIISQHVQAEEYKVGSLNASCSETCAGLGKSCNPAINTLNSVYMFKMAGTVCKYPRTASDVLSAYYQNKEDPFYLPSTGICYGFARVPVNIDCAAKHHERQRLCRCT